MSWKKSGWKRSSFDGRDRIFSGKATPAKENRVVLRDPVPVRDQGDVPCCVSIAIAECMEILDAQSGATLILSPLFHYYFARSSKSSLGAVSFRDGLSVALNRGICPAEFHDVSFSAEGAFLKPSKDAIKRAYEKRLAGYDSSTGKMSYEYIGGAGAKERWKAALSGGCPILAGFWMTSAYERILQGEARHGTEVMEPSTEGHAVAIVGFDDLASCFIVKDSRGTKAGKDGYWELPYSLAEHPLIEEAWVLRRITYDS